MFYLGNSCLSSSKRWLERHRNDQYVKKANKLGLRSRAAFKLIEIQEKYRFIASHDTLLDLGSAPGSWSEACLEWTKSGKIIACDLLNMPPISGINFIQGDFTNRDIQTKILDLCHHNVDVIISDMSPNKTGIKKVDQWQSTALSESLLYFAEQNLKPGGNLLFKSFHGDGFEDIIKQCRSMFKSVKSIKPDASRKISTEIFLLCLEKKTNP